MRGHAGISADEVLFPRVTLEARARQTPLPQTPTAPTPPLDRAAGRHHASQSRGDELLRQHGSRFVSFSAIGGGIFVAGLLIQAVLTSGLHVSSLASYLVQAVVSVESSYFLNRWVTWQETRTPLWGSFLRFNLQKVVTVSANLIAYWLLLKLGVEYLLANILLTVIFTFINYIGADRLVFLRGGRQLVAAVTGPLPIITGPLPPLRADRQPAARPRSVRRELPSVSVVIPVRGNEETIRAAVDSILRQDYPLLRELILVGSPGDSTWSALRGVRDPRLFLAETETPPGIRDANFKRDLGIRRTSGDLVSLIDSDMIIPPDWMSTAVRLLTENDVDCVAGVMRSIRDDFWGRFVDRNRLGAKTPRAKTAYLVTADGFGAAGYKPPITADILFTRGMYDDCPIDGNWSHGSLEDYEWFWRVVARGHRVLVSNRIFGWHHHRSGFGKLTAEYRRSARGCAYFIRAHRESPFAQKRMAQAIVLPLAALGVLLGFAGTVSMGYGLVTVAGATVVLVTGMLFLSGREFARSRTIESLLYPVPALVLGLNYTASLVTHLLRNGHLRSTAGRPPAPLRRLTSGQITAAFVAVLAAGVAIRLWRLGISPAWQFDETIYLRVSENLRQHHALAEHNVYGQPFQPFLYQPPMFFELESRWFGLVGASVYHARLLGVICTGVLQVLLFGLLARLHGLRVALLAILPVVFDGWLLYIERVSYIENALVILVVLGFLLYARALQAPCWWRFLVAGLALGAAASFKQTGAYVVVAVVLCWLIVRRNHRGHLIMLAGALLVIAGYLAVMIAKYDPPGSHWFIHQSLVQVRRVLGLQQSGGTLTSFSGAVHLLTQQYKYFLPSLIVAVGAVGLALRRTWQCFRARSWAPARSNPVLYAWLVTGLAVFGGSSLKFPQYFVLILLPAYCYFWTELARWELDPWWRTFWPIAAAVVGMMSFLLTIPAFNANALAEVQTYAAGRIPANAIVVTEETIGDLINQRWCSVENATACLGHASYAITWQTYLQSSFNEGDAAFRTLMKGATRVTSFSGAAGTATVWRLGSGR